jgi:hypothetical protein
MSHAAEYHSYTDAYTASRSLHQPLIICIGATWCGPCREVEATCKAALVAKGCYVHLDIDNPADKVTIEQIGTPAVIPAIVEYDPCPTGFACYRFIGADQIRVHIGLPRLGVAVGIGGGPARTVPHYEPRYEPRRRR